MDTLRLITALGLLCLVAHGCGFLFSRLRQPPVIGEIVGGILLGPTCLRLVAPHLAQAVLPTSGPVADGLNALYQIGQLLLIFLAGSELRIRAAGRERRTGVAVAAAGLLVPFAAGAALAVADGGRFVGPLGSSVTTPLIVGMAMAIAAIPVISRIMLDLGIVDTPFGRTVLMVAVVEDVVLYVVLALVLGMGHAGAGGSVGLWQSFGSHSLGLTALYIVTVSLLFLWAGLSWGPRAFRRLAVHRSNILARRSPVAFRLVFLFAVVACCVGLGVNSVFGALIAGICAARGDAGTEDPGTEALAAQAWGAIRQFSLAFFVPVFFAMVGMNVDLAQSFDPLFFGWFLLAACGVKTLSVWGAARLAGEERGFAGSLAIALNARGTLGVVLAGVTYQAGLINKPFFTVLVLVSLVTSQLAGVRLGLTAHRLRSQAPEPTAADRERPGVPVELR